MNEINKGKINNIDVENRRVKVNINNTNNISAALCVPDFIDITSLSKEDLVVFTVFEDGSGVILAKIWS